MRSRSFGLQRPIFAAVHASAISRRTLPQGWNSASPCPFACSSAYYWLPRLIESKDAADPAQVRRRVFVATMWAVTVFPTRISVRFVGERARKGESVADLLEDYPALGPEDLEFAKMYVALGRPPGRPRKRPKFVRGDG